jgi:hypothetical protein
MCWRERVCSHLQRAIVELECAVAEMPVSFERLLLDRALRTCTLSFSECARSLDLLAAGGRSSEVEHQRGARP